MWIVVTLVAAAFQTARTALQHRLRKLLSVGGAGFVRYAYGAPISLSSVAVMALAGVSLPQIPVRFWPTVAAAGVAQIVATNLLIRAFDTRSFSLGTVYAKTEVAQVAVFSWVLLGEPVNGLAWIAIAVCLVGVVKLAVPAGAQARTLLFGAGDRAALFGIAAGGGFGLAAVGIRAAANSLTGADAVPRALVTLAVMNTIQTIVHGTYLAVNDRPQIGLAFKHWRSSAVVGVLSVCGSAGWAIAMTLQNAARVRTLGQVELLFTFAIAAFVLKEKHTRNEITASGLIALGVIGVMLV